MEVSSNKKNSLTREEILEAATPSTAAERRCEECDIVFQNLSAKKLHLRRSHGKQEAIEEKEDSKISISDDFYQCSDCVKSFKLRKLLIQHFQKVHIPKNIKCKECGKAFALQRDLKYHQTNRCRKRKRKVVDTVTQVNDRPMTVEDVLKRLDFELPPHLKIIDISKMVTTQTETGANVSDARLQVYVEQPYYDASEQQQYSNQSEPLYINQYQQTYATPCTTYPDWRNSETQTQNATNTIGTTTPYWPQENGYANESATQTWYSQEQQEPQMIDSYSMTEEQAQYPIMYENVK